MQFDLLCGITSKNGMDLKPLSVRVEERLMPRIELLHSTTDLQDMSAIVQLYG